MTRAARPNSWLAFFEQEAPVYEQEVFTQNTLAEVDFIIEELGLTPDQKVLDLGCGIGRHAVELARRGLKVTGVDLSPDMLAQARAKASSAGIELALIECDAQEYQSEQRFDAAICLCEGALGLLGDEDDSLDRDVRILTNICLALKPGGKFLTTVLNAGRPLRMYTDEDVAAGRFDPINLIETNEFEVGPAERRTKITVRERSFTPPEFIRMLRAAGFVVDHVWGGTAGDWGHRPLKLDEYEIMAAAHRPR